MKKNYEKPMVEVVKFQYRDQVVAQSGNSGTCHYYYENNQSDDASCFSHWVTSGFSA